MIHIILIHIKSIICAFTNLDLGVYTSDVSTVFVQSDDLLIQEENVTHGYIKIKCWGKVGYMYVCGVLK